MKRILAILLVLSLVFAFAGCGEKKVLHCDKCGTEIKVDASSNMDESWDVYCDDCGADVEAELEEIIE